MLNFFKKTFCIILCLCELLLLANCNTKALPMNEVVSKILLEKGIEKSKITRLCNNDNKFVSMYQKFSITITQEDLNKYVEELLSAHKQTTGNSQLKSSDAYILDYYGCRTEEEFLNKCELRLKEIKRKEQKSISDEDFLNKIAKECKFSINKEEAVEYSKQIVEQHKNLAYISGLELEEYITQTLNMTQDEFYDYCYDCGVNEIKQYLLIGANTADATFDGESFAEFCSMTGYDSNDNENAQSKYHYLKTITIAYYRHSVIHLVAYVVPLFEDKTFSLEVYESSNLYAMNSSDYKKHTITAEEENKLINSIANLSLGETRYTDTLNQLYNYVLILRSDDEIVAVIMLDDVNKLVKMYQSDGDTVYDTFEKTDLDELLTDVVK